MKYRDLALVVRLLNLTTRSRTVAIIGALILLGFSIYQQAWAVCPEGQLTKVYAGPPNCSVGGYAHQSCLPPEGGSSFPSLEAANAAFRSGIPIGSESGGGTQWDTSYPFIPYVWSSHVCNGTDALCTANFTWPDPHDGSTQWQGARQTFTETCIAQQPPPTPTPEEQQHAADEALCAAQEGTTKVFQVGEAATPGCFAGCEWSPPLTGSSTTNMTVGILSGSGGIQTQKTDYENTGHACGSSTPDVPGEDVSEQTENLPGQPDPEAAQCVQAGSIKVCTGKENKKNCGYLNGAYVCLGANTLTPQNPCVEGQNGSVVCIAGTTPPKAPDNGTAGQAAAPQTVATLQHPAGGTVTVVGYSPSTVAASSNGGGTGTTAGNQVGVGGTGTGANAPGQGGAGTAPSGAADGTGSDEDGTCEEGEGSPDCGQDSIGGGDDCEAPPSCTSDQNPIDCYLAKQEWTNACVHKTPTAAQGLEALQDGFGSAKGVALGDMLPVHETIDAATWTNSISPGAGSCLPDIPLNFSVFGQSFNADIPVSDICPFTQFMRAAILIAAMFAGFRIYMEGFA